MLIPALRAPAVVAGGVALGAVVTAGAAVAGPVAAVLPVVVVVGAILLLHPTWALGVLVAVAVLLEEDEESLLPVGEQLHTNLPGLPLSPIDLLVATLIGAVLADVVRRGAQWRLPGPLTPPLLVLALAGAGGAVVGLSGGASSHDVVAAAINLGYLVVLPFLVVNVLRGEPALRAALAFGLVLAAAKGLEGTVTWALGRGPALDDATITFLAPTPNFALLLLLLGVAALWFAGNRVPARLLLVSPFALAAFALAYRRNFWIGGAAALVVVAVVAGGRAGRARLVPWAAVVAGLLVMVLSGVVGDVRGPVVERVGSLSPAKLRASSDDRYRLDEARNVIAEIRESPVAGLGFGRPWTARYPLPQEHPGGRDYTHVVALWFWLKTGLLGLVGYVWLMGAAIVAAFGLARATRDTGIRAAAIALGAGLVGLALAETTGAFTGVEGRFGLLLGALLGWLAAALQSTEPAAAPAGARLEPVA